MKLSLLTKRNKKIFELKINKKSKFLRSLPKERYEGLKRVEEGKTELIIDKILGLGEFERDYGFFCPKKNKTETPKNLLLSQNVKSNLKNKISDFIQKENSNKYDKYIYEEDSDYIFKSRDNIEPKNNNKYWRPKKLTVSPLPSSNSKRYLNKKKDTFFTKVGNNIINSQSIFDKDNYDSKKINIKIENNNNSFSN